MFDVTLSGGITSDADGRPATVSYRTQFASHNAVYVITPTSGEHGSIDPSGAQEVADGDTRTFTVTSANGYHVDDVVVDGVSVGPVTSYTFAGVTADHTISATFAVDTSAIVLTSTSASSIGFGSAFAIEGTLTGDGIGLADERVVLQSAPPRGSYADTSHSATTTAGGAFVFSVRQMTKTYYRVRFAGSGPYSVSRSATSVFALPKVNVRTPIAPPRMSHSRYYTVFGSIKPKHTAGTYPVRIYKWKRTASGTWKSYGYVSAKASNYSTYTKYARRIRLPYRGRWRLRAFAPADSGHAATWSSGFDYVTVP